jgi:Raf kinase inhibitor-like YbhB/YbcL family protein
MLVTASLLLGGCGLLGKPPKLSAAAPLTMSVTSPDFIGNVIPAAFTCHGSGETGPTIFWSGAPPGTKSIALVVDNAAAPITPWVYWIVYDISYSTTDRTTDLTLGKAPPHARVAENSAGNAGYDPPCPAGSPQSYRFTVYALNTYFGSALPANSQLLTAWTMIAQHVIARGTISARALPSGPANQRNQSSGSASDAARAMRSAARGELCRLPAVESALA